MKNDDRSRYVNSPIKALTPVTKSLSMQGILGPNGMATDPVSGDLVMCQHGERRVAR